MGSVGSVGSVGRITNSNQQSTINKQQSSKTRYLLLVTRYSLLVTSRKPYSSIPATQAVIKQAREPAIIALRANLAKSC